jgi:hypothetical protein
VQAVLVRHIGKEGNKLEEREVALVTSESEFLNRYDDPARSLWARYALPALRTFAVKDIAEATRRGPGPALAPRIAEATAATGEPLWATNPGVPQRTIRDIVAGRTHPTREHERALTAAASRLAAERLQAEGIEPIRTAPGSPFLANAACLSRYLEDLARRVDAAAEALRAWGSEPPEDPAGVIRAYHAERKRRERRCACGCGESLPSQRATYFPPACRTRAYRQRQPARHQ